MLASQLIYDFQNLRSGGTQSITNELSDRQVYFILNSYRTLLIDRDQKSRNKLSPLLLQDLGECKIECLEGEYRLKKALPASIQLDYVGGVDRRTPWQATTQSKAAWERHSRFTFWLPRYYLQDEYLYFQGTEARKCRIVGIFEDPLQANLYNGTPDPYNEFNFEYPMPLKYRDTIFKMMADAEFKVLGINPPDTTNNSNDD